MLARARYKILICEVLFDEARVGLDKHLFLGLQLLFLINYFRWKGVDFSLIVIRWQAR